MPIRAPAATRGRGGAGAGGAGAVPAHGSRPTARFLGSQPVGRDLPTHPLLDGMGREGGPGQHPGPLAAGADDADAVVGEEHGLDGHRLGRRPCRAAPGPRAGRFGGRARRGRDAARWRHPAIPAGHPRTRPLPSMVHTISAPSRPQGNPCPVPRLPGPGSAQAWRMASRSGRYPMRVTPASETIWSRPRSATSSTSSATRARQSVATARSSGVSTAGRRVQLGEAGPERGQQVREGEAVAHGGQRGEAVGEQHPLVRGQLPDGEAHVGLGLGTEQAQGKGEVHGQFEVDVEELRPQQRGRRDGRPGG